MHVILLVNITVVLLVKNHDKFYLPEIKFWHFLGTTIAIFRTFLAPDINQYVLAPERVNFIQFLGPEMAPFLDPEIFWVG